MAVSHGFQFERAIARTDGDRRMRREIAEADKPRRTSCPTREHRFATARRRSTPLSYEDLVDDPLNHFLDGQECRCSDFTFVFPDGTRINAIEVSLI